MSGPHHYVYVIELSPRASRSGRPVVYVGCTGLTPRERFAQHRAGVKASRKVRTHGRRLRPDLGQLGPLSYAAARQAERALAAQLRAAGYEVFGGT